MKHTGDEKKFINKVWQKIHLLNYEKHEAELVKKNNKKHLKQVVFYLICFLLLPLVASGFVFWLYGVNTYTLLATGFVLLSLCVMYENTSYNNAGDYYNGNKDL